MFENRLLEIRRRRLLLGACCALVGVAGLQQLFPDLLLTPVVIRISENPLFDSHPGYTLRVIQSIGILLPLFAGLLRFTTNDQTDVNAQVNDYLLLGILGLVLAGMVAALAGVGTNVAGILKISLFFVLLTFTVIGIATVVMFREIPSSMNRSPSDQERNGKGTEEADTSVQESEAESDDSENRDSAETDSTTDRKDEKINSELKASGE